MVLIQLNLEEHLLAALLAAAAERKSTLNAFICERLAADFGALQEEVKGPSEEDIEELAKALHQVALQQSPDGQFYLVEDLYKQFRPGTWALQGRGSRILLGKAFKRVVDAAPKDGALISGKQVRVERVGTTVQNQAKYQTKVVEN
jgi:hypothetical protein